MFYVFKHNEPLTCNENVSILYRHFYMTYISKQDLEQEGWLFSFTINVHASQIKIALVGRGCQNRHKMKVPYSCLCNIFKYIAVRETRSTPVAHLKRASSEPPTSVDNDQTWQLTSRWQKLTWYTKDKLKVMYPQAVKQEHGGAAVRWGSSHILKNLSHVSVKTAQNLPIHPWEAYQT